MQILKRIEARVSLPDVDWEQVYKRDTAVEPVLEIYLGSSWQDQLCVQTIEDDLDISSISCLEWKNS